MRLFGRATLCTLALFLLFAMTAYAESPKEVTLTVLHTSDVHGRLTNYNYSTGREEKCGLVKCATIIKEERKKDPQLVLVDCGDISQGNLVSEFRNDKVPVVAKVFNAMGYEFWQVGNHEFNFEYPALRAIINNFKGVTLGSNIYEASGKRVAPAFVIKDIKGVKVAFIGVDAPHIPDWEDDPDHYNHMRFVTPKVELGKVLNELKPYDPDVTIVMAHYGEEGENGEDGMYSIGAMYSKQIDAFLIGHSHNELLKYYNGNRWDDTPNENVQTCMMETGLEAHNVGKLTINLQQNDDGKWVINNRKVELLNCAEAPPDPEIQLVLKDLHERSMAISNRVCGLVSSDFSEDPMYLPHIPKAVLGPSAIIDLMNTVMIQYSGADISMAALLEESSNIKAGEFRFKDACKVYRYDNTLMAVKITGAQLKLIMERNAGRFFNTPVPGDVTLSFNPRMRLYNFGIFKGVDYEIDVSKPRGRRIQNLRYKGQPVAVDQEMVLALNNYNYADLLNAKLLHANDVIYTSGKLTKNALIREMIAQYITEKKTIDPVVENNWKIVGYNFDDPQKDLIYDMIRQGKIAIPSTNGGRSLNSKSVNANDLRAENILPALEK